MRGATKWKTALRWLRARDQHRHHRRCLLGCWLRGQGGARSARGMSPVFVQQMTARLGRAHCAFSTGSHLLRRGRWRLCCRCLPQAHRRLGLPLLALTASHCIKREEKGNCTEGVVLRIEKCRCIMEVGRGMTQCITRHAFGYDCHNKFFFFFRG